MDGGCESRLPMAQEKAVDRQLLHDYERIIVRIQMERADLLWPCIGALLMETGRDVQWRRAERHMENSFRKNLLARPKAVAEQARAMRHIEVRLAGLMVVRAQTIKRRVKMRVHRGGSGKRGRAPRDVLFSGAGSGADPSRVELLNGFEEVVHRMSRRRRDLAEIGLTILLKHLGLVDEWTKVNAYMETLLQKYPSYTPWRVASQARHYHRINQRMMPKLIRLAQLAKKRVMFRRKWKSDREEGAIWTGLEQPMNSLLEEREIGVTP